MMMPQPQFCSTDMLLRAPYDAAWFEMVFQAIDRLHDAVSAGGPATVSILAPAEMVGWLEDILYTAQEALAEIRAKSEYVTGADKNSLESEVHHVRFDLN
jgi:hypothetical protein